jgi:hypothetical protein
VDLFELSGGAAELVDETVTPTYRSRIRELTVHGRDLRWPERDARELSVEARGPGEARFALDASLRDGRGRVKLDLEDLGLASFSPYVAEAAGYWIEDGEITLEAEVEVAGSKVEVDGDLDSHRLGVTEVSADSFDKEFGLSLDLALALLRDPAGRISLPIRASYDAEAGGGVSLAPIVAAVLRQAIVGAVTSPLKGLGMLLGGGADAKGMQYAGLPAEPGEVEPARASQKQLRAFARILAERPGLVVVVRGRAVPADDPALAQAILIEAIREDADLPPVSAGFLQKRRLRSSLEQRGEGKAGRLDPEDAALLESWIASVEVPESKREELAQARALALKTRLLNERGVKESRIRVGKPLSGDPGVVLELAPASR